ncbi:uncharacterized protein V1518DRAFT_415529 [Limtongia smithiae]|uniref:uncharacterized protein n=1 Tax=Limtongia smithiae TaxID=1125753 RepID=UPI0034CDC28E
MSVSSPFSPSGESPSDRRRSQQYPFLVHTHAPLHSSPLASASPISSASAPAGPTASSAYASGYPPSFSTRKSDPGALYPPTLLPVPVPVRENVQQQEHLRIENNSNPPVDYYSQRTTRLPSAFPPSPVKLPAGQRRPRQDSLALPPRSVGGPGGKPSTPLAPLIPEAYVEVGAQRMYALALFGLMQAWKVYDIVQIHRHNSTDAELAFAFKFLVIDGLYLWALPVFRIPWLTFSPAATLLQILACSMWTLGLSMTSAFPIGTFFGSLWRAVYDREISISEHRIRAKDIVPSADHISGRHIVHILPESTAKLNPRGETFCLHGSGGTVYIPLLLNATEPKNVQLYHVRYEDTSYTTLNYTRRELRRQMTDLSHESQKIFEVKLPVKEPGLYRLARVTDSANLDVKVFKVDVLLTYCPSARISSSADTTEDDRCIGGVDKPTLTVNGVPPLRVKYSRSVKGRDSMFSVQSIQPDVFSSPLLQGKPARNGRIWHAGETLEWAEQRAIDIALDTTLGTVGRWVYVIDEVEDGIGNVVNYSKIYETQDREESKDLTAKGLNYGFLVHPRPSVRFAGCGTEHPVNLAKGKAVLVPLSLQGVQDEGPYMIKYKYAPLEDDGAIATADTEILEHTMRTGMEKMQITKPGVYSLEGVQGRYCEGDILESATCFALMPAEPTLSVKFEDIEDKCAGSIGVTADLTLTGTPPFELRYQVRTNRGIKNERLVIQKTRHQLRFTPDSAGTYVYEFFMLSDSLYKSLPLNREQFRTEQTVKVLASASFAASSLTSRCCTGDAVELGVDLHGTGPFALTYEVVYGNKRKQHSAVAIDGTRYVLRTPELSSGGQYIVSLMSVEDGNGCKRTLSEADARIEVRRQRPSAQFGAIDGRMSAKTLKGQSVQVPLRLTGEAPWQLTYVQRNASGEGKNITVDRYNTNEEWISAKDEGEYELLEVFDAYCSGVIPEGAASKFELSWFARPRLELVSSPSQETDTDGVTVRQDICEGDEDSLEIALYGTAPFSVLYEREYRALEGGSVAVIPTSVYDLQAGTKYANIHMEAHKAGVYTYTFRGVSDGVYDKKVASDAFEPVTVRQVVQRRPEAAFVQPGAVYKSCWKVEAEDESLAAIPVRLTGQAPFVLSVRVKHESTGQTDIVTMSNIKDGEYNLRSLYGSLALGRHVVTLGKVTDGRGCAREQFGVSIGPAGASSVTIVVSDVPTITPSSPRRHYCVGERISYSLSGLAPFEVEYEFNGKRQRATTGTPFVRLASAAGNFTITGLRDSASACRVNVGKSEEGALTALIHEVPSVKVSEGASRVQDIHEGDRAEIVFRFKGTPPFAFTYTRSERTGGRAGRERVVETHTVTEVMEHSYSMFTAVEGVYEAVWVEDRYCRTGVYDG